MHANSVSFCSEESQWNFSWAFEKCAAGVKYEWYLYIQKDVGKPFCANWMATSASWNVGGK